jgi:hypothetical protein
MLPNYDDFLITRFEQPDLLVIVESRQKKVILYLPWTRRRWSPLVPRKYGVAVNTIS